MDASVAALPSPSAAERQYRWADGDADTALRGLKTARLWMNMLAHVVMMLHAKRC